ncbi:hypothetical protein GGR52DRAFT_549464 [Hypoxylon sp. FL1284]|nr:hypothetical protein GGR52DRAFT_549464 [Hypoxylon sp. FL1284]
MVRLLSQDFEDRNRYENISNPIATTWLISFSHVSCDYPPARSASHAQLATRKRIMGRMGDECDSAPYRRVSIS